MSDRSPNDFGIELSRKVTTRIAISKRIDHS